MKTKLSLLFAALAAVAAPAQADFTESSIAITLKFYFNATEPATKGDISSLNYTTAALKNSDIIAAYNAANETNIALNSRIIRQDEFDDEGGFVDFKILIRDKVLGDVDVSEIFNFDSSETDAVKFSYSISKDTGSYSAIYGRSLEVMVDPEVPEESEELSITGLERITLKTVIVKTTQNLVDLAAVSANLSGYAYFYNLKADDIFNGIAEGTYKESGAKIVTVAPVIKSQP